MTKEGYEDWPELNISMRSGAYLYATNGKLACIIGSDGTRHWQPHMENSEIDRWTHFGIYDPSEQTEMDRKVQQLIDELAKKYNG